MAILALEGIDASGKASQAAALEQRFRDTDEFTVVKRFDFPHYETTAGRTVGRILCGDIIVAEEDYVYDTLRMMEFGPNDRPTPDRARRALQASWSLDKALIIQSVMLADRLEHYRMLLDFSESHNRLLILDRYWLSGIVYGQVDGLDRDWLFATHEVLPTPDLFFLLDISVEESTLRRPERRDYYERNLPKLRKVREQYLAEAKRDPTGIKVIDAAREPSVITDEIFSIAMRKIG